MKPLLSRDCSLFEYRGRCQASERRCLDRQFDDVSTRTRCGECGYRTRPRVGLVQPVVMLTGSASVPGDVDAMSDY